MFGWCTHSRDEGDFGGLGPSVSMTSYDMSIMLFKDCVCFTDMSLQPVT